MHTSPHANLVSPLGKAFFMCALAFGVSGFFVDRTDAAFVASATIEGNSVTTAVIQPPLPPGPGDVVINEVMWMGSSDPNDEWIELRNTTSRTIDLSGWKVDGLGAGVATIAIPSGTLEAHSFFLISNFVATTSSMRNDIIVDYVTTSVSLLNTGEQLTLKDASGVVIDQTPAAPPMWAAGENTLLKKSMERNEIPGDGTLATSWHTCIDTACNDTIFWDVEGSNYGTPRAANLSANDPTAEDFDPQISKGELSEATTTEAEPVVVVDDAGVVPEEITDTPEDPGDESASTDPTQEDVLGEVHDGPAGDTPDDHVGSSEEQNTQEDVPQESDDEPPDTLPQSDSVADSAGGDNESNTLI